VAKATKAARRQAARLAEHCQAARGAFRDLLYCRLAQLDSGAAYARQAFAKAVSAGPSGCRLSGVLRRLANGL
jgi:hypothetical protein